MLGTLCIVCIFAFLFLVPFVLDPAISTLMHEFVDSPVTCRVSQVEVKHGKSNCKWSSCREGCTADMFQCYQVSSNLSDKWICEEIVVSDLEVLSQFQVRVQYARIPYKNDTHASSIPDSEWVQLTRWDQLEEKVMHDTPLLVNIKGCGYPPDIACALFASNYETIAENQNTFPCFYSKLNPWIVLERWLLWALQKIYLCLVLVMYFYRYDFSETIANIVASVVIPNGIFLVSLIILLYWYCPYCQARCKKYEEQMDQDEKEDQ